jgi:outer membrane lipoprotein-sorting protein
MNILRRLPLSRLLLACALAIAVGVSATALAFALGAGPTPPAKPLAEAIHDALAGTGGEQIRGVSASVTLTDHLLEGANLATGGGDGTSSPEGELTSNPLITGASGRLWIGDDGDIRLELQSEQGDTEILFDGHTVTVYDAATNTLYRYTPPAGERGSGSGGSWGSDAHEVPSVAKIEAAIAHLSKHADVSGATPTDVAGQPAYTVRISPNEAGGLFGGVELSFDANHGVPLRAAIYSSTSSSPVIELAASEISYGPVAASVFEINPPANAKVQEITTPSGGEHATPAHTADKPKITTSGHGPATIAIVASSQSEESKIKKDAQGSDEEPAEGLPKVTIDGVSAEELRTELGTLLSFERNGVRYLLAGSVTPAAIEEVARGL